MTDTDPEMMRRQQNMDTQQTIEGEGKPGPADLDERDGRDRLSALRSGAEPTDRQQDSVFAQNTRARTAGQSENLSVAAQRRLGGLVRRGRSLLGS